MTSRSPRRSPRLARLVPAPVSGAAFGLVFLLLFGCTPPDPPTGRGASQGADATGGATEAGADDEAVTSESAKSESPARKVEIASARRGTVRDTITLSTTLEARRTVQVPVRVSGTVASVDRRPGEFVEAGTELLAIESRTFELAVREQQLAHSEASQRATIADLAREEAQRNEEIALLSAEKAERELQRIEGLLREIGPKSVSQEAVEAARFARDEARLSHARAKLVSRRAASDQELARIAVERTQVSLDAALLDLERAVVRAPIAGAVTFLQIRPGEQVAAATTVASIVDRSDLECTVRVPQRRLASLAVGQPVEIEAETHSGETFRGVVEAIVPVVDPDGGTIEARVRVIDESGRLRPGAFLSARIILSERVDALLVPKRARLFEGNDSYLFVVREDRAVRLPVRTGLFTTDAIEIVPSAGPLPDLTEGEPVITRGQSRLRGGEKVAITIADGVAVEVSEDGGEVSAEGERGDDGEPNPENRAPENRATENRAPDADDTARGDDRRATAGSTARR